MLALILLLLYLIYQPTPGIVKPPSTSTTPALYSETLPYTSQPTYEYASSRNDIIIDGDLTEWWLTSTLENPPEVVDVKFSQTDNGIAVSGRVPATTYTDTFSITLSAPERPHLPPIGWGNQFGKEYLTTPDECATYSSVASTFNESTCRAWHKKQQHLRQQLAQLFEYHWLVTPHSSRETTANDAWQNLAVVSEHFLDPAFAPPTNDLIDLAITNQTHYYTFEALIPWEAVPPQANLVVDDLLITLSLPETANHSTTLATQLIFNDPKIYQLTDCQYPLLSFNQYDEPQPAYYKPQNHSLIDHVFIVQNVVEGYLYDPSDVEISPAIYQMQYTTQPVGDNQFICGPVLRYLNNNQINIQSETLVDPTILQNDFMVHPAPDGGWLVVEEPHWDMYSRFGTGAGGGANVLETRVYVVHPDGSITSAWNYVGAPPYDNTQDPPLDVDLAFSDDLTEVTVWSGYGIIEESGLSWTEQKYCYQTIEQIYTQCQAEQPSIEPNPRHYPRSYE